MPIDFSKYQKKTIEKKPEKFYTPRQTFDEFLPYFIKEFELLDVNPLGFVVFDDLKSRFLERYNISESEFDEYVIKFYREDKQLGFCVNKEEDREHTWIMIEKIADFKKTEKKPKKPKILEEAIVSIDLQELFNELAQTSDFKRLVYRSIVGKTHRGSDKLLENKLSKLLKEVRGDK